MRRWDGEEYGNGEVSVQSMWEMEKDFFPNFLQPLLETFDRRSCNDGNRKLIPVFHNLHRKCGGPHLVVHFRRALLGRVETERGITTSDQYPKGGN